MRPIRNRVSALRLWITCIILGESIPSKIEAVLSKIKPVPFKSLDIR